MFIVPVLFITHSYCTVPLQSKALPCWHFPDTYPLPHDRKALDRVFDSMFDELYSQFSTRHCWRVFPEVPSVLEVTGILRSLSVFSSLISVTGSADSRLETGSNIEFRWPSRTLTASHTTNKKREGKKWQNADHEEGLPAHFWHYAASPPAGFEFGTFLRRCAVFIHFWKSQTGWYHLPRSIAEALCRAIRGAACRRPSA